MLTNGAAGSCLVVMVTRPASCSLKHPHSSSPTRVQREPDGSAVGGRGRQVASEFNLLDKLTYKIMMVAGFCVLLVPLWGPTGLAGEDRAVS